MAAALGLGAQGGKATLTLDIAIAKKPLMLCGVLLDAMVSHVFNRKHRKSLYECPQQ
jgi:hypothetical protein